MDYIVNRKGGGQVTGFRDHRCLAGCATAFDWCASNRPIRPTEEKVDTMSGGAARQLLKHNRTGVKIFGWKA